MEPTVSVVMTVFNAEAHLPEAIESVLSQTMAEFEFIIVNDGSIDGTNGIIEKYAAQDDRIIPVVNAENKGQSFSRNLAIKKAKGEYVEIMDADDVSVASRLKTQVHYLKKHPDVGVVGSLVGMIDEEGVQLGTIEGYVATAAEVFWRELTQLPSSMYHSTVMFRRALIQRHNLYYNTEFLHSQDKELWGRMVLYGNGVVLPCVLLKYRVHPDSISQSQSESQREYALRAMIQMNRNVFGKESLFATELEEMATKGCPVGSNGWNVKNELLDKLTEMSRFDAPEIRMLRGMEWINAGIFSVGWRRLDWWRYGFAFVGIPAMFRILFRKGGRFCNKLVLRFRTV